MNFNGIGSALIKEAAGNGDMSYGKAMALGSGAAGKYVLDRSKKAAVVPAANEFFNMVQKAKKEDIQRRWEGLKNLEVKEARIFGETPPQVLYSNHSGISSDTRKRKYEQYLKDKSIEPESDLGLSLLGGAIPGALLGAVGGMAHSGNPVRATPVIVGSLIGGALGAGFGAIARAADAAEIGRSKQLLAMAKKDKTVLEDDLSERVSRNYENDKWSRENREERRHREMMNAIYSR